MNSIVSEKRFISERLGVPYENLSQSYLRSETLLSTNAVIDFVLQTNKKTIPLVTERLLDLNDEFVITHFSVGLKSIASDTPTNLEQLVAPVLTYDNTTAFAGANGGNVAAIYNSDLSFTIDRKVFDISFYDLNKLFLDCNIVVKNATNFKLKTVANAMYKISARRQKASEMA